MRLAEKLDWKGLMANINLNYSKKFESYRAANTRYLGYKQDRQFIYTITP
jgi:hypothetical protein